MRTSTVSFLTVSSILASAVIFAPEPQQVAPKPAPELRSVRATPGMVFEPNLGQASSDARFLVRGPQYAIALKPDRMTLGFASAEAHEPLQVSMEVVNANPAAKGEGQQALPSKSHYYVGNDPAKWRTGVPHFESVRFSDVYEGIDLIYHPAEQKPQATRGAELEYDFVVAPGIDPDVIQLRFYGHEQISIHPSGDLVLETSAGELRHGRPVVYQQIAGVRHEVAGRYRLSDLGTLGFSVGEYDNAQPLVIDPIVRDAQHVGGPNNEIISDIEICNEQNLLVTAGQTLSTTFLGGEGASNGAAMFVATFNNDPLAGTPLTLANFAIIDGNNEDMANAIAVDSQCNIFGVGASNSTDVPITEGPDNAGDFDAYTFALNAEAELLFARRTGGDGPDEGISIDLREFISIDDEHVILLAQAGHTFSDDLTVSWGDEYSGGSDLFSRISVLGEAGGTLAERASTTSYHGGSGDDDDSRIRFLRASLNELDARTFDLAFAQA